MKHQVLARVFSVVLVILCLLMLVTGVRGFDKAEKELGERRAYEEKFAGRIQNYVELEAELAGSISYDEAREELDRLVEQHERDASQHRTDTALHTAEKGGNIMGADIIWELMPQLKGAKQELEEGKRLLSQKEAAYAQAKPGIVAAVASGLAACAAEKASIADLPGALNAYLAENPVPTLPQEPQMPAAPIEVEAPGEFTETEPRREDYVTAQEPTAPGEDASEEDLAAYQDALALYQEELSGQEAAYGAAQAEYQAKKAAYDFRKESYESLPARKAAYEEALAQYQSDMNAYQTAALALQAWQGGYAAIIAAYAESVGTLASDLSAAADSLAALAAELGGDTGSTGGLGGLGGGMLSPGMLAGQPPEAIAAALSAAVDGISGGFGAISTGLGQIESGLAQGRGQLAAAEVELKKAEGELNGQLENIWLNLGELEKEAEELAEEKEALDEEASVLSKKLLENEALKELTNRRNSARQLLLNVPEVKAESAESGDLPAAAEHYLESYKVRTQELDEGMRRVNLLSILGAAAGILGIPGAFELLKKRFFQLTPVLLCLGFAAGAAWLHYELGLGQLYVALFTAIFAAIQCLIILPRNRTIV